LERAYDHVGFSFYVGPFAEFDKVLYYEESFFERQDEAILENPFQSVRFVGQREIRPGIKTGIKLVTTSNFVLELGVRLGWYFEEDLPSEVEYTPRYNFLWPELKVGYRLGEKYKKKPVE